MATQTPHKTSRASIAHEAAAELDAAAERLGLTSRTEIVALLADFIPETKAEYDAIREAAERSGETIPEFMKAAAQWRAKSLAAIDARLKSPEAQESEKKILDAYESAKRQYEGDVSKITMHTIRILCGARNDRTARVLQAHGLEYSGWKPGQAKEEDAEAVAEKPKAKGRKA